MPKLYTGSICGILSSHREPLDLKTHLESMMSQRAFRGVEGSRVWTSADGVALGGRLTHSPSKRWMVACDGTIYNHQELRESLALRGCVLNGCSNVSLLAAAIENYGLEETLLCLVGKFTLAAWDTENKRLLLARDQLGQKPLFYGLHNNEFVFGSDLRGLDTFKVRPDLDIDSMALMLRYKFIPEPRTIYKGIKKLCPGSWVAFDLNRWELSIPRTYWHPECALGTTTVANLCEAKTQIGHLLDRAVAQQMSSVTPPGAFLSGGIDSSLVVSTMTNLTSSPVKTFTVRFGDRQFNEADQAKEIARYLETDHTELAISEHDALESVPYIGTYYDEPFGDSSQIPTILLSRLTRKHVSTALSGDAGDEAFGGYNRHVWLPPIASVLSRLSPSLRSQLARILRSSGFRTGLMFASERGLLPVRLLHDKLDKLASLVNCGSLDTLYRDVLSDWKSPENIIRGVRVGKVEESRIGWVLGTALDQLSLADTTFYLPGDVLTKVGRASAACSLEVSSPFLDHRLFEFGLGLERRFKIHRFKGKYLLRQLLNDRLPSELFTRPKMGFAAPISSWLRTELKSWATDLLMSADDSLFNKGIILNTWHEHLTGSRNHHHRLWNVLMLLSWIETNKSNQS